jgi:hypothetical protein
MRNRDYWQAKLEHAQKELAVLRDKLAGGVPRMLANHSSTGWRVSTIRLKAFTKKQKQYAAMLRRAKMLESKIPFYEERIRACTLTKWDRLLAD